MSSIILRGASGFLFTLLTVFSVFILLRGHNEPGGGFIGGLLLASAFMLYDLSNGPGSGRRLLRVDPRTILGIGLVVAAVSGLPALFWGEPYMKGLWLAEPVPGIGKLGTVLAFDVGVYLVVQGATLTILLTLSEQEEEDEPC